MLWAVTLLTPGGVTESDVAGVGDDVTVVAVVADALAGAVLVAPVLAIREAGAVIGAVDVMPEPGEMDAVSVRDMSVVFSPLTLAVSCALIGVVVVEVCGMVTTDVFETALVVVTAGVMLVEADGAAKP